MRTMQEKMLDKIDQIVTQRGAEAVRMSRYANTGVVMCQRDLSTAWTLEYDFQPENCRMILKGPAVDGLAPEDNPPHWRVHDPGVISWHVLKYADENRMVEFFDTLQVVSSTDAVLA